MRISTRSVPVRSVQSAADDWNKGHRRPWLPTTTTYFSRPLTRGCCAAARAARPPAWFAAWYRLRTSSPDEDRLSVYQAVRDAGSVPPEAAFFLISWVVDAITLADAEEVLAAQQDRLADIKAKHGLEVDDDWPENQVPQEYEQAQVEFFEAWDELYAEQLEAHNEPDMARTFRDDHDQFERLGEAGRQFFARTPEEDGNVSWLEALRADIAGCLTADAELGRLEMLHDESDGAWQITVYPTAPDAEDVPAFGLDVERLRAAFGTVGECAWHVPGDDDPLGPALQIKGAYRNHVVLLTVLTRQPDVAMEDE